MHPGGFTGRWESSNILFLHPVAGSYDILLCSTVHYCTWALPNISTTCVCPAVILACQPIPIQKPAGIHWSTELRRQASASARERSRVESEMEAGSARCTPLPPKVSPILSNKCCRVVAYPVMSYIAKITVVRSHVPGLLTPVRTQLQLFPIASSSFAATAKCCSMETCIIARCSDASQDNGCWGTMCRSTLRAPLLCCHAGCKLGGKAAEARSRSSCSNRGSSRSERFGHQQRCSSSGKCSTQRA